MVVLVPYIYMQYPFTPEASPIPESWYLADKKNPAASNKPIERIAALATTKNFLKGFAFMQLDKINNFRINISDKDYIGTTFMYSFPRSSVAVHDESTLHVMS